MAADAFIHCRVPGATKVAFSVMARRQGMTDSALLRRMIDLSLQSAGVVSATGADADGQAAARMARLTVRLRTDDQLLLRERAAARSMAAATYVSVYVRAHLRSLAPLPKEELLALKKTIAALGAIGRNLNQLASAANQGERTAASRRHVRRFTANSGPSNPESGRLKADMKNAMRHDVMIDCNYTALPYTL
jgi:hypothetical protein